VVQPGPPTEQLVVRDVTDGTAIVRPVGTDGSADTSASQGSSTTSTTLPSQPVNIAATGAVSASTTFPGGQFPASNAVDGDVSTSWFSAGPDAGPTIFTWIAPQPVHVDQVQIIGNGQNADPSIRKNFGFGSVDVLIKNGDITSVDGTFDGPGNTVPMVTVPLNSNLTSITLTFHGHEDPQRRCGGFAELVILG
jgi:hypothetical protein